MKEQSPILKYIVNQDLCVGCGVCASVCPNSAISFDWNDKGFLIPSVSDACDLSGKCIKVCPFNPFPDEDVRTEDELAKSFLADAPNRNKDAGYYYDTYAGYSNEYRSTSSSGGIATYVMAQLLEDGIVDYVFSVKYSGEKDQFYKYSVSNTKEELLEASKTKYYPVTMATVLSELDKLNGKIAIVGVGCFIKSIRLLQHYDQNLKEKIPFLVGIICGGIKSRFFGEYLASKTGVTDLQHFTKPEFRIKDLKSTASDYSFGCEDPNGLKKTVKMRTVGDMWGTGLFKNNACDFCDDVMTELADISLGDAWLKPYVEEGEGANVIVTRSKLADDIIKKGLSIGKLEIEKLSVSAVLSSQQGSFNHRHNGLRYRMKYFQSRGFILPSKRHVDKKSTLDFKLVQAARIDVRKKSLEVWPTVNDAVTFDSVMFNTLNRLRSRTKLNHQLIKIRKALRLIK